MTRRWFSHRLSCTQVEDLPQQVEGDLVDTTWPRLQELLEKHPEARAGAPGRAQNISSLRRLVPALLAAVRRGRDLPVVLHRDGLRPAAGFVYYYPAALRHGRRVRLDGAVGLLFGGPLLNATADALQMFLQRRVATRCRGAIMVLIYDKARRVDMAAASLPPAAAGRGRPQKKESGGGRVGEVVGLMSADVQNALTAIAYFHWVWGPVIQLVITLCALLAGTRRRRRRFDRHRAEYGAEQGHLWEISGGIQGVPLREKLPFGARDGNVAGLAHHQDARLRVGHF